MKLSLFAPEITREFVQGDDIAQVVAESCTQNGYTFADRDVLVVTHKIVSKCEGQIVCLSSVHPDTEAVKYASLCGKPSALVQVILNQCAKVLRVKNGHFIVKHKLGFICANGAVDRSNSGGKDTIILLPQNPDESAKRIAQGILSLTAKHVAVVIADTHGRPFRKGAIGVAIGCYGLKPLKSYRGEHDRDGNTLVSSEEAVADELCSAATLLMGQAAESRPIAVIRGCQFDFAENGITDLLRREEEELFV